MFIKYCSLVTHAIVFCWSYYTTIFGLLHEYLHELMLFKTNNPTWAADFNRNVQSCTVRPSAMFWVTYGPPKSAKESILHQNPNSTSTQWSKGIRQNVTSNHKGDRYGSTAEINELSSRLKSSHPVFLPLENHGNIVGCKVCHRRQRIWIRNAKKERSGKWWEVCTLHAPLYGESPLTESEQEGRCRRQRERDREGER